MSAETITAISSGVIALAALVIALWQGIVTRRHNKLSVMPILRMDFHTTRAAGSIKVLLSNKGTGPAIVTSLEVMVDGTAHTRGPGADISDALDAAGILTKACYGYTPLPREALGSEETWVLLDYPLSEKEGDNSERIESGLKRLTFRVHYESIYKERYLLEFPTK